MATELAVVRLAWLCAAAFGLVLTLFLLYISLGDVEAVRKGGVQNGRRLLASVALEGDIALILVFGAKLGVAITLLVVGPASYSDPDLAWWVVVRTGVGLALPTLVLAAWSARRLYARRRLWIALDMHRVRGAEAQYGDEEG